MNREYLDRLLRLGYRPRVLADGTPCSVVERGCGSHRYFVMSVPKAGTYLVADVLSALGVQNSRLHIDEGWVSDYRDYQPGIRLWDCQFEMPAMDALPLILPGQYAVGHLPATASYAKAMGGFRAIFAFRELRHVLVSWARFAIEHPVHDLVLEAAERFQEGPERVWWALGRPWSAWLLPTCRAMVGWSRLPGILPVRFEDLAGENGARAQAETALRIVQHLDLPVGTEDAAQVARDSVGRKTLTYSGSRSTLATHWDARLEEWFRQVGGPALNLALGYGDDAAA